MKFLSQIATSISDINRAIGRLISWSTLLLVILVFVLAVLRYAFKIGSIPLQETVLYLFSIVFMFGASYTLADDGHVRVDMLYNNYSEHKKAWVNLLGTVFLLLPVCLLIIETSYGYVKISWAIGESSGEAGGLPYLYLFKSLLLIMPALLMLQGLAVIMQSIITLQKKGSKHD